MHQRIGKFPINQRSWLIHHRTFLFLSHHLQIYTTFTRSSVIIFLQKQLLLNNFCINCRIFNKENEPFEIFKFREHEHRSSKVPNRQLNSSDRNKYFQNQSTPDKRHRSSKISSNSIFSRSPSTGIRSNLLNNSSPSRENKDNRLPLSTTLLSNDVRPPPRIKILELNAEIESKPTLIDETSSSVLKYKTPQFKSYVTFQMPAIDENQSWKIGWIQACTHMEFFSNSINVFNELFHLICSK